MFSRLENFFKASDRRTDPVDTRMAVRRDEDRAQDRKNKPGKKAEDPALWEDRLEVTVPALIAFLKGLTGQKGGTATKSRTDDPGRPPEQKHTDHKAGHKKEQAGPTPSAPPKPAANPESSRAAQAYRHTQQSTGGAPPQSPVDSENTLPAGVTLTEEDMREIHRLIADLGTLSKRGVNTLSIERSDSLLHSLRQAVNARL